MKRTADQIRTLLEKRQLFPGSTVRYTARYGGRHADIHRFGCVKATEESELLKGNIRIITSNGTHSISVVEHEVICMPDVKDPIAADLKEIYG